jgi:hypothetical protein
MRIGIDFDNTIVCYDGVFHRAAMERGMIPSDLPGSKIAVRDFLNRSGRQDAFTELQGYVYGTRMGLAALYPRVRDFVSAAHRAGHRLFIVSHKTKHPLSGPRHDLHAAAFGFLREQGLAGTDAILPGDIYLEPEREAKLARIADLDCQVFIDDLPEVLAAPGFPASVRAILFDPEGIAQGGFESYRDWAGIAGAVLGSGMEAHAAE